MPALRPSESSKMKASLGNSKARYFLSLEYPGIGIETLKALHATGAHVFGTIRDVEKGQAVVDSILAEKIKTGGKITLIEMELDSLASVRVGAQDYLQQSKILNVLINNAGAMATLLKAELKTTLVLNSARTT